MKTLALTLTLFISVYANAQFTKPTSKLFDAAEGKLIANFSDSIKIAIGQQESGWYPTTTKVIVPKTAVSSDSVLFAEIELILTCFLLFLKLLVSFQHPYQFLVRSYNI